MGLQSLGRRKKTKTIPSFILPNISTIPIFHPAYFPVRAPSGTRPSTGSRATPETSGCPRKNYSTLLLYFWCTIWMHVFVCVWMVIKVKWVMHIEKCLYETHPLIVIFHNLFQHCLHIHLKEWKKSKILKSTKSIFQLFLSWTWLVFINVTWCC